MGSRRSWRNCANAGDEGGDQPVHAAAQGLAHSAAEVGRILAGHPFRCTAIAEIARRRRSTFSSTSASTQRRGDHRAAKPQPKRSATGPRSQRLRRKRDAWLNPTSHCDRGRCGRGPPARRRFRRFFAACEELGVLQCGETQSRRLEHCAKQLCNGLLLSAFLSDLCVSALNSIGGGMRVPHSLAASPRCARAPSPVSASWDSIPEVGRGEARRSARLAEARGPQHFPKRSWFCPPRFRS